MRQLGVRAQGNSSGERNCCKPACVQQVCMRVKGNSSTAIVASRRACSK